MLLVITAIVIVQGVISWFRLDPLERHRIVMEMPPSGNDATGCAIALAAVFVFGSLFFMIFMIEWISQNS